MKKRLHNIRKIVSVLAVIMFIIATIPYSVFAEDMSGEEPEITESISDDTGSEDINDEIYLDETTDEGFSEELLLEVTEEELEVTEEELEVTEEELEVTEEELEVTEEEDEIVSTEESVSEDVDLDENDIPEDEELGLNGVQDTMDYMEIEDVISIDVEEVQPVATKSGPYIVVIDAGHCATHPGASGNGLREEDVTLSIAKYCKAELETYNNVIVYLTRTDGSCLNPSSSGACLTARTTFAQSVGADLLVSIHADASTNSSSKGALVIVAGQSGYRDDISAQTRTLGQIALNNLSSLGLKSRGLYIRWSDSTGSQYVYPNGAKADWYAITRNSLKAGFPGIIIEHGFITNSSDAVTFLATEDSRKKLGITDATSIAQYLGLTKITINSSLETDPDELYTEDTQDVAGFVRNLYVRVLGRNPSKKEVASWLSAVANNKMTGGQLVRGFVYSDEFQNKNYSNDEFVEKLYEIFLGRSSDAAGKAAWVQQLNDGASKESIVQGFEGSKEFTNFCARYGIGQNDVSTKNSKIYVDVADFVTDYYVGFLGRYPDEGGLEAWTTLLVNGGTAADLTRGFVLSPEFMNRNMSKEDFVECLYNTYLQRNSDAAGKAAWVNQLSSMDWNSKQTVIQGFLYSPEYRNCCAKYGIEVGIL